MTEPPPTPPEPLHYQAPRPLRPWWVVFSLWGLPNRASVWAFFWICLLIAVAGVVAMWWYPAAGLGGLMALAALMYFLAIRWVDEHDQWK